MLSLARLDGQRRRRAMLHQSWVQMKESRNRIIAELPGDAGEENILLPPVEARTVERILRRKRTTVIVVGANSAGKSSVVNTLLGCDAAVVDEGYTSISVVVYRRGERFRVAKRPADHPDPADSDDDWINYPEADFNVRLLAVVREHTARPENATNEQIAQLSRMRVTIEGPFAALDPGLELWDTPGWGELDGITDQVRNALADRPLIIGVYGRENFLSTENEFAQFLRASFAPESESPNRGDNETTESPDADTSGDTADDDGDNGNSNDDSSSSRLRAIPPVFWISNKADKPRRNEYWREGDDVSPPSPDERLRRQRERRRELFERSSAPRVRVPGAEDWACFSATETDDDLHSDGDGMNPHARDLREKLGTWVAAADDDELKRCMSSIRRGTRMPLDALRGRSKAEQALILQETKQVKQIVKTVRDKCQVKIPPIFIKFSAEVMSKLNNDKTAILHKVRLMQLGQGLDESVRTDENLPLAQERFRSQFSALILDHCSAEIHDVQEQANAAAMECIQEALAAEPRAHLNSILKEGLCAALDIDHVGMFVEGTGGGIISVIGIGASIAAAWAAEGGIATALWFLGGWMATGGAMFIGGLVYAAIQMLKTQYYDGNWKESLAKSVFTKLTTENLFNPSALGDRVVESIVETLERLNVYAASKQATFRLEIRERMRLRAVLREDMLRLARVDTVLNAMAFEDRYRVDIETDPDGNPVVLGAGNFGRVLAAKMCHRATNVTHDVAVKEVFRATDERPMEVWTASCCDTSARAQGGGPESGRSGNGHDGSGGVSGVSDEPTPPNIRGRTVKVHGVLIADELGEYDGVPSADLRFGDEEPLRTRLVCERLHGTLENHVVGMMEAGIYNMRCAFDLMLQVAQILRILFASGVIHRDLAADNFLMTDDGEVVLADFGLGTFSGMVLYAAGRTMRLAPEVIAGDIPKITHQSDIFTAGIVLWELLPRRRFVPGTAISALLDASPLEVDNRLVQLVKSCLEIRPEDRMKHGEMLFQQLKSIRDALVDDGTLERAPPARPRDECPVCMDAHVEVEFSPCGHRAACAACAERLDRCPLCRVVIDGRVEGYFHRVFRGENYI